MEQKIVQIIKARKSIFPPQMQKGKKLDDDHIKSLLEMANYAPSHKRTEPWRFIVFSGEQVKTFYDNMFSLYKLKNPLSASIEMKRKKWEMKAKSVSHVIAVCMKRDEKERIPKCEEEWAVACAIQNILLSASHFGAAGYWGTGDLAYTEEMKKYLGLGIDDSCMGFLQFGLIKDDLNLVEKKPLTPIEEKIIWK